MKKLERIHGWILTEVRKFVVKDLCNQGVPILKLYENIPNLFEIPLLLDNPIRTIIEQESDEVLRKLG